MMDILHDMEQLCEPSISLYIRPGDNIETLNIPELHIRGEENIPPELFITASRSLTGAIFFWGRSQKYMIMPPFPVMHSSISFDYAIEGLKSILETNYRIAVILIRLGAYGIGLFEGEKLLESKTGRGLVHSRHKKGGSSQRRFERHRQKQIEYFFTRICERAREKLAPYLQQIDHVYYGGERNTINLFLKQCDFCARFEGKAAARLLDIRAPGQDSLLRSILEVYSCRAVQATPQDSAG